MQLPNMSNAVMRSAKLKVLFIEGIIYDPVEHKIHILGEWGIGPLACFTRDTWNTL